MNGTLNEVVYMNQPQGFISEKHPSYVCKLKKALYGLRQASRAWNDKLKHTLLQWNFKQSKVDNSQFFLASETDILFALIYVDDIVITGNNSQHLQEYIDKINVSFALKDLGNLRQFLGIEVRRDDTGLYLKQTRYGMDLLKRLGYEHLKPSPTPMVTGKPISKDEGRAMKDPTLYRSAIGGLQYLVHTRPDITYAVNRLSKYLQQPTDTHWKALKRVFKYIKGTLTYGLAIQKNDSLEITAFADSDWASNPDDRRSTAGYCVYIGDNLVSRCSNKQHVVARSSTEAEYRALAHCTAEVTWIQSLLKELGISQQQVPIIWCDNLNASALASNPVYHARTKHIELDAHFVRDKVLDNQLKIQYIPSADQTADLLTKPMSHSRFQLLRNKLGVIEHTPP